MILIQALLLAITANLASGRVWSPITWPFCYPLINGTIVGIILGNPLLGLTAGATINLAYIGWISAGGTMPSNIGIAGVYGTAITCFGGSKSGTWNHFGNSDWSSWNITLELTDDTEFFLGT